VAALRILSLATVFPSPAFPNHGLFVHERLQHLARRADVRVVAPVPWAQRLRRKLRVDVRAAEDAALPVERPTFVYVPRILKATDGAALAASVARAVRRIRRAFDFDVIDAHFGYPEGFAAVLLGRALDRPVSITLRGTEPTHARERLLRRALGWALRRADGLIAVGGPLGDLAARLGAARERIAVVPNGVDASTFRAVPRDEARRRLGVGDDFLPEGARLLVAVGHLCPRKGFELLVEAAARLVREGREVRVAIVGGPGLEGDSRPSIEAAIAATGMRGRVHMAGPADAPRVALWQAAADLAVLASDHEGCPNVVLEALACGAPVVATEVGNVRDILREGADGLIVTPRDVRALAAGLARALETDWDRGAIAARAAARTWDRVAEEHLAALVATAVRRGAIGVLPAAA
jgi:glycosyltransferase involved in cell wall biosynthesis